MKTRNSLKCALDGFLAIKKQQKNPNQNVNEKIANSYPYGLDEPDGEPKFELLKDKGNSPRRKSNDSILDDMTKCEANVYSSTVSIPAYYQNEKNKQRRQLKTILKKISGIPLALFYGLFFFFIMRYMILDDPNFREMIVSAGSGIVKANKSDSFFFYETEIIVDAPQYNATIQTNFQYPPAPIAKQETETEEKDPEIVNTTKVVKEHNIFDESEPHLIYVGSTLSLSLAIGSVYSRGTRCTLMLILPGMITRRSQAFVLTFIAGLLAQGPLANLSYNFNELLENLLCLYERITQNVQNFIKIIKKRVDNLSKPGDIVQIKIEFMSNFTWDAFRNVLQVPQLNETKIQLAIIRKKMEDFGDKCTIVRKALTLISIIILIHDAIKYLRKYYTDSSFDNMYVSKKTQQLWKQRDYDSLIPLRYWEKKGGYTIPKSRKFTRKELKKIFRASLPFVMFAMFAVIVMVMDYLLAQLIRNVKNRKRVTIHVSSPILQELKEINLDMKSCISEPIYTNWHVYLWISVLLFFAIISYVLEVHMSRIRSRMCDFFYSERAQERADYLHFRISSGRINRKFQLNLIVRRELERRARMEEFSPWFRLKMFCRRTIKRRKMICPGCGYKSVTEKAKLIEFEVKGKSNIRERVCEDCYKDFADNPLQRTPIGKRKKFLPSMNFSAMFVNEDDNMNSLESPDEAAV